MSYTPTYGDSVEHMSVRKPEETTQIGCVWCLKENVNSPASFNIVYYWGGTSMCARHLQPYLDQQGSQ